MDLQNYGWCSQWEPLTCLFLIYTKNIYLPRFRKIFMAEKIVGIPVLEKNHCFSITEMNQ